MFLHTHIQNTQGCADLSFPKLEKFGKFVRSIFGIPHLFSEFLKLWKREVLLVRTLRLWFCETRKQGKTLQSTLQSLL